MVHHSQMTSFDVAELSKNFQADIWLTEHFGCEFIMGKNSWLNCSCPFDDHADTSPSFGINLEKGIFKCFGCGKCGNFVKLVGLLLKKDQIDAIKLISDATGYDLSALDTIEHKYEKFKKALEEKNQSQEKINKLILKATIKIKKIMERDFEIAEKYYQELDEIIVQNNIKALRNFIDEKIK
jgi:CHC2 zinc finger